MLRRQPRRCRDRAAFSPKFVSVNALAPGPVTTRRRNSSASISSGHGSELIELLAHVRGKLARFEIPRDVTFIE